MPQGADGQDQRICCLVLSAGKDAVTHCGTRMNCLDLSEPIPAGRRNPLAIDTFSENRVESQANLLPRLIEQQWQLISTLKASA